MPAYGVAGFIIAGMHIVVAPDSFKGTASAAKAAAGIANGIRQHYPTASITTLPMADGGEGTAQVLAQAAAAGGQETQTITLPTTDAVGRLTEAQYFLAGHTAFIDVAAATGLPAVRDALDPLHADSYGTGVLLADAQSRGATSIVLKWQLIAQPQFNLALMAWLAAAVATAIIVIAAVIRGAKAETMVLLGIGLVFFFQAMLALIQYQSSAEALQQIVFWSMGSLTRANWVANGVLAGVLLVALPILWALSWRLTALRLGDARAAAMGINTARLRVVVLIVVSLVAATTVAFAGIIGFIGLVGPHIARMLVGEDQRYFVPASMAAGAAVMCAAHAASLMIKPGLAIPIGIVTSLLGVPFFIAIVMTRRRALWT